MSLAEGILWFLSTFVGCYGTTLIVRGLRGEGIRKKWKKSTSEEERTRYRPTWRLVGLGVLALAGGGVAAWGAGLLYEELNVSGNPSPLTPWHVMIGGVLVFGLALLTHSLIGDRAKGRKRCPRCWYDLAGASFAGEGDEQSLTCPECGREVRQEKDLGRARRSKLAVGAGVLLVGLSLSIGTWLSLVDTNRGVPGLIPNWLFARMMIWSGESMPTWISDEADERCFGQYDVPFARAYLDAWLAASLDSESVRENVTLAWWANRVVSEASSTYTMDDLHDLYLGVYRAYMPGLRADICSDDPEVQRRASAITQYVMTVPASVELAAPQVRGDSAISLDVIKQDLASLMASIPYPEDFGEVISADNPEVALSAIYLIGRNESGKFATELNDLIQTSDTSAAWYAAAHIGETALNDPDMLAKIKALIESEDPLDRRAGTMCARGYYSAAMIEGQPIDPDPLRDSLEQLVQNAENGQMDVLLAMSALERLETSRQLVLSHSIELAKADDTPGLVRTWFRHPREEWLDAARIWATECGPMIQQRLASELPVHQYSISQAHSSTASVEWTQEQARLANIELFTLLSQSDAIEVRERAEQQLELLVPDDSDEN